MGKILSLMHTSKIPIHLWTCETGKNILYFQNTKTVQGKDDIPIPKGIK
jgi:hypothetical protein